LQDAIAKPQPMHHSTSSLGSDDDTGDGMGAGLSLPGFVADFLKGVGDRLQIKVRNVQLDVHMNLDTSGLDGSSMEPKATERVTMRLVVDEIHLDQVSRRDASLQNRRISLQGIRCMLVSNAAFFTRLSSMSTPPSPVTQHTSPHRLALNSSESVMSSRLAESMKNPTLDQSISDAGTVGEASLVGNIAQTTASLGSAPPTNDNLAASQQSIQSSMYNDSLRPSLYESDTSYNQYEDFDNPHD
jgi:autophagy-related protein 2